MAASGECSVVAVRTSSSKKKAGRYSATTSACVSAKSTAEKARRSSCVSATSGTQYQSQPRHRLRSQRSVGRQHATQQPSADRHDSMSANMLSNVPPERKADFRASRAGARAMTAEPAAAAAAAAPEDRRSSWIARSQRSSASHATDVSAESSK